VSKAKKSAKKSGAKAAKKVQPKAARPAPKTAKAAKATTPTKAAKATKAVTPAVARAEASPAETAAATGVSREALNGTVPRAVTLLRAIGTSEDIRTAMASVGYDPTEHQRGWSLVHAASGFVPDGAPPSQDSGTTAAAIARIDASDEDAFRIVRASLSRRFPTQAELVLTGIGPSKGAASVVGMRKLLERLDTLEHGKDREATRADDHAALALLAKRGLTPAWRAEMRDHVRDAETLTPAAPAAAASNTAKPDVDHVADLEALRAWFEEWAELAHVAVKRRDLLIRMGLARRKTKKKGDDEEKNDGKGGGGGTP
jgi:hypothetical protein